MKFILKFSILIGILTLISVTIISYLFQDYLELINIALLHLIPIIIVSMKGDMKYSLAITFISVILFDVLYVPPVYSFTVHDIVYLWSFIIFFIVGYIISWQSKMLIDKTNIIHDKERFNEIKEVILNTLSHDLKTPLSSILGSVNLLQNKILDIKTQNNLLFDIENATKRMNLLISNLLDSARLEDKNSNLKMDWCDIEDILGVALNEFNEDDLKYLKIDIDKTLELFWGDNVLLSRLIVNLIDNAIKYSIKKELKIDVINSEDKIKIKICNDGKAIKNDELKIIFDKFHRLDNCGDISGSGIGLSICKSIVKAHFGEIKAYNILNGICFEIALPKIKKPIELKEDI